MSLTTNHNSIRGNADAGSILVAVGGGKGGVGKSFVSSNLGIFLATMGFNTVIVDLDLGAPNLHTVLGEQAPSRNYHEFLSGQFASIADVAVPTQFPKLRLISGANDHQELANISGDSQTDLMKALFHLEADFTILDLSAGTHTSTLDFFLMAHRHIVTLTPDPTSIENAYRFMKAVYFRKVKRFEKQLQLDGVINDIMKKPDQYKVKIPADLMTTLLAVEPERGRQLLSYMNELHFELIMNQTRSSKDVQLARSIEAVSRKYFGLPVHLLGNIDHDNAVWHALRKRRPLTLEFPNSALYSQILSVARDLASPHLKKAVI